MEWGLVWGLGERDKEDVGDWRVRGAADDEVGFTRVFIVAEPFSCVSGMALTNLLSNFIF